MALDPGRSIGVGLARQVAFGSSSTSPVRDSPGLVHRIESGRVPPSQRSRCLGNLRMHAADLRARGAGEPCPRGLPSAAVFKALVGRAHLQAGNALLDSIGARRARRSVK